MQLSTRFLASLLFVSGMLLLGGCKHLPGAADPLPNAGINVQVVTLPGAVPLSMRWIPAGTFLMGAYPGEQDAHKDEMPQHAATVSRGFWLGQFEVTQAQWRAVMGTSPWAGQQYVAEGGDCPAVCVSWDDAQAFIAKLNQQTGKSFRLPTEAEWEYACRAGSTTRFYWGDDPGLDNIDAYVWWKGTVAITDEQCARPVGRKRPNAWGLYDMAGNVFEWCQDWHGTYPDGTAIDPAGPSAGTRRVERGGGWMNIGGHGRSARRGHDKPSAAFEDLGFRLACTADPPSGMAAEAGLPEPVNVFTAGTEGVDTYRIPSLIAAPDGTLLAFCEARKESMADASPTDMILRRSVDGGRTWLPTQTLVPGNGDEAWMNPCPVVDREKNAVLLFCMDANRLSEGHNGHALLTSLDNGKTWSSPVEAAPMISNYDDTFVSGPGVGIQMNSGRLVIPGYAGEFSNDIKAGFHSCVLYSDDHGKHWTLGAPVAEFSDESQVVEVNDGTLMLNMRGDMGKSCRGVAISSDGGASWKPLRWDRALNDCPCQASLVRYSAPDDGGRNRLLFANPDNAGEEFGAVERTRMTVRVSYDEGKTWPIKKLIHAGPSSYSSLLRLPGGDIGLLFEGGDKHRREWIRFVRFSLSWLTGGADALPPSRP